PTIGWDILKYIEDLNEIKSYAWSEKICKVLMDSVDGHSSRPEKVTGCVIALLVCAKTIY
ncbi:hypothetical protein KK466_29775, partial [Klebsiella pneumoniae]|uniref:hypothetical protein n=1 Tax=Klebsiella pneumoniae TaxID=573 RepID=UPI001BE10C78